MWLNKVKHPLQEHAYALYPLVTIITVIIISCRISALSRANIWHKIPSPWSTVVSFGDNYSDSGNGAHITGGKYPSEPWYWHHRFTNGPNWVDNLILDLGGLDKVKMRNFAHGGATSDNALAASSLLGHSIPGTHQQVRGFIYKSRHTGYPKTESTLYTIWTGANDLLALGGVGSSKLQPKPGNIHESIFQDILQLERESHNKIKYVLVLTPPPVEDSPMVKHEHSAARTSIQTAAEALTRDLPRALFEKFKAIGNTVMSDSNALGAMHPPYKLPHNRKLASSPISHYLTVDLPQSYEHTLPREHNGTRPGSPGHASSSLFLHTNTKPSDGLHRPLLRMRKRSDEHHPIPHLNIPNVHAKADMSGTRKLHVMVYDAYHFIKHVESNPSCFGLDPTMMNKPCGDQKHCYDRVWMDDTNLSTPVHYWLARDINVRLHLWHMHNNNVSLEKTFKNSTRAHELEMEMLGYACPMKPAPVNF
ncbi:hypothetical protein LPJ78_002117 [Coemansia sp. RSA 989]|nr:hypothetical protein BX667DRAFT_498706 [Coemansia mojavensis]KAJ1866118.1 hypothetical protein LPJ78_002117 [Coemansia sp. RSA 989]KAJ1875982.1 hypothetical protein LPJ55_000162 [Coemansia sp. RSA 990]KAJ2674117.1 hypothetical protein IWW42_001937 [Coemansia sp. RSA 1085]